MLEGVDLFRNHLVLGRARGGLAAACASPTCASGRQRIASRSPSRPTRRSPTPTPEFDTTRLPLSATSRSCTPNSVFDYDMDTRDAKLLKQTDVLGGYDRDAVRRRSAS